MRVGRKMKIAAVACAACVGLVALLLGLAYLRWKSLMSTPLPEAEAFAQELLLRVPPNWDEGALLEAFIVGGGGDRSQVGTVVNELSKVYRSRHGGCRLIGELQRTGVMVGSIEGATFRANLDCDKGPATIDIELAHGPKGWQLQRIKVTPVVKN